MASPPSLETCLTKHRFLLHLTSYAHTTPTRFGRICGRKTDRDRHQDPTNPSSTRDSVSNVVLKGSHNVFAQLYL